MKHVEWLGPSDSSLPRRTLLGALGPGRTESTDILSSQSFDLLQGGVDLELDALQTLRLLNEVATMRLGGSARFVQRMCHIVECIAASHGLGVRYQDMLLHAASLHDIGMVAVPDSILSKAGELSASERKVINSHTELGYRLLCESRMPALRLGAEISLAHHEHWDGSGYPNSLSGESIPLSARIVAVADVFDALISRRPHKEAWDIDSAFAEIVKQSARHFDPAVVESFIATRDRVQMVIESFEDHESSLAK